MGPCEIKMLPLKKKTVFGTWGKQNTCDIKVERARLLKEEIFKYSNGVEDNGI